MAKNHLTGNVQAPAYFGPLGDEPIANIISGAFHGDGTNVTNVARVVANDVNDYVVTLGNQAQSLVGEPNPKIQRNTALRQCSCNCFFFVPNSFNKWYR